MMLELADIRKKLRACAVEALENRGFIVRTLEVPRVVRGARLTTTDREGREKTVAVRTSQDRKVVLQKGGMSNIWLTLRDVDEVVVAVPSLDSPVLAEIICFDRRTLRDAFDARVALDVRENEVTPALQEVLGRRRRRAPVTMDIDELPTDPEQVRSNLVAKAMWREIVPVHAENAMVGKLSSPPIAPQKSVGFIERVRKEFAELNGVNVDKVKVSFKIED